MHLMHLCVNVPADLFIAALKLHFAKAQKVANQVRGIDGSWVGVANQV